MQILCPGGADDSEKWAQPPAGRDAQRARCPAAGTAHARTHLSTYLPTNIIDKEINDRSFFSQCFADTAHNPYTNARPAVIPGAASDEQAGKMMMDPLKPNNIMSHLPRPKPYQPFQVLNLFRLFSPLFIHLTRQQMNLLFVSVDRVQVETKRPVTPQTSVPLAQSASKPSTANVVPPGRVLSPLVTAGTTTTAPPTRPATDEAALAAQARLAAAAALVSKSVRKSADFNPNGAGSRGSLADYPGSSTGFTAASKRSSFAGTPTCKSEFIYSINAPTFNTPPASNLPHHFHYPVHPETIHGSASSLQHQNRDSLNSSKGSLYSASDEQQSHQQAQVMTRIKKSFEQKEEFLKRPALPYWVNVQEAQQSPPVPKEFYAQPQKFARPVWPPVSASSTTSLDSLSELTVATTVSAVAVTTHKSSSSSSTTGVTRTEVIPIGVTAIEPWSVSFTSKRATPPSSPSQSPGTVGLGLVPNTVPKPFYGSAGTGAAANAGSPSGNKQFVSTLSRIQENIAAEPLETKPSRQLTLMHAPLASPEEFFTPSPTKASQHPLAVAPVVVKRTKPFENGAEKGLLARIAQRGKQQQQETVSAAASAVPAVAAAAVAAAPPAERYSNINGATFCLTLSRFRVLTVIHFLSPPVCVSLAKPSAEFQRVPAGSGNRTVIIGSSKLHCQPPAVEEYDLPPSTTTNALGESRPAGPPLFLSQIFQMKPKKKEKTKKR